MTERFIIARFSAIFIFTMEMKYKGTKSLKSAFKTEISESEPLCSMNTWLTFNTLSPFDMVSGFSICDEVALYIGFDGRVNLS